MKEKEARVDYKKHQLVLYVEKRDGSYGPMQTGSYITKNFVSDYWLKKKHLHEECIEKIKNSEMSPIHYYMLMEELSISELASRTKMSKGKVKKHLTPKHFGKVTLDELQRYSYVFNVPLNNLLQIVVCKKKNLKVSIENTENPYFKIINIQEGRK